MDIEIEVRLEHRQLVRDQVAGKDEGQKQQQQNYTGVERHRDGDRGERGQFAEDGLLGRRGEEGDGEVGRADRGGGRHDDCGQLGLIVHERERDV